MSANNYIRIGDHPGLTLLPFDDKDPAEIERVKAKVLEVTGGRPYSNIVQWKQCRGFSYPLVGEPGRSSSPSYLV